MDGVSQCLIYNMPLQTENIPINLPSLIISARRKVTGWLVDEIGNMTIGGTPQLIVNKQTLWRVPAVLTSTSKGVVSEVGTVDVDAETG